MSTFRGDDGQVWTVRNTWPCAAGYHEVEAADGKLSVRRTSDLATAGLLTPGDETTFDGTTWEGLEEIQRYLDEAPVRMDARVFDTLMEAARYAD